jgi:uncharacterized membrane protein
MFNILFMNESQIHLSLTHVPVILSFAGLIVLAVALIIKNDTVAKTSFYLLLFAGLMAIPVFFTGEGAEEMVEKLPGVSENIISRHETIATISMTVIALTGALALIGLLLYKRASFAKAARFIVLIFAIASAALMAQTAHLGGQIRHTEIRPGFTAAGDNVTNAEAQSEKKADD